MFGVWAMDDETDSRRRYISQVYTGLRRHEDCIDSSSIVLGDFNWNARWDESPKSPLYGDLSDTVEILEGNGLYSVYHAIHDTDFGAEEKPTFYMHKKETRPYHTDYVFASNKVVDSVTDFWIGGYANWIEHSDHMPLVLDIDD